MNPFHLLQAAPSAATSPLVQMVPYLLMFVIFYFVLLAPMRKQQKKQKELLAALKKGDRVVTSGGIHGTIAQVEEDRLAQDRRHGQDQGEPQRHRGAERRGRLEGIGYVVRN